MLKDIRLPDIITILSLGKEAEVQVAVDQTGSSAYPAIALPVWAGNARGEAEVTADTFIGLSSPNGRLDSFRRFSVALPADLPAGEYYAFAALVEPGSAQAGNLQIIGRVSLSSFIFSPRRVLWKSA